jgi:hypothetical protein
MDGMCELHVAMFFCGIGGGNRILWLSGAGDISPYLEVPLLCSPSGYMGMWEGPSFWFGGPLRALVPVVDVA